MFPSREGAIVVWIGVTRHDFSMSAYVYILSSDRNGTLYVGVTTSLPRRVFEHQSGLIEGFTKTYAVNRLVYVEEHARIDEAIAREKQLKSWKRAWKIDLIENSNPNWMDLAETGLFRSIPPDVIPDQRGAAERRSGIQTYVARQVRLNPYLRLLQLMSSLRSRSCLDTGSRDAAARHAVRYDGAPVGLAIAKVAPRQFRLARHGPAPRPGARKSFALKSPLYSFLKPRSDLSGRKRGLPVTVQSASTSNAYAQPDEQRLVMAERQGLRLAIICRTIAVGAAFLWVGASWAFFGFYPSLWVFVSLGAFTAIGVAHASVIGTRFDRPWMKFAIYMIDALGICAAFALFPISQGAEVPQILAFRAYGIYYLFPLVAMAALSLSPRLVLWTGAMAVTGWWAAFLLITSGMERTLSWSDLSPSPSRGDYEAVFLSIDFIGRGNRVEETGFLFIATAILALAVGRARKVFRAQVQAQADRERIAATLGRYVPEAIARRLIEDPSALKPQERHAAILVMDIAGFTAYSAKRSPTEVIEHLNDFLAGCADIVGGQNGVVIQFTGDGLMASFGTPIESTSPEKEAVMASRDLLTRAEKAGFSIRIGVAAGPVASGSIGSSNRQAFTVYGDTVNRAARLEAHAKTLRRAVLFDETVAESIGGGLEKFEAQSLPGLPQAITVYAVA